jgi:cytoskeletal protein RodZ
MPASNSEEPKPPEKNEEERDRRAANIFLLIAAAVLIGVGVWLADAMIAAKKADDCLSSGRRNCSPIEVPPR